MIVRKSFIVYSSTTNIWMLNTQKSSQPYSIKQQRITAIGCIYDRQRNSFSQSSNNNGVLEHEHNHW